jgi:PhnB protein
LKKSERPCDPCTLKSGQYGSNDFYTFPGHPHQIGSQVTIAITVNDVEKSKELFGKLQEGGQVVMPLQETFFSPSYGQVTDKFGVTWHVSTLVADHN